MILIFFLFFVAIEDLDEEPYTPAPKKRRTAPRTSTPASAANNQSCLSGIVSTLKLSKSLKITSFNLVKDDPCIWIGSFEKAVEDQGPVQDIAFKLLFNFLDEYGQNWHFKYKQNNDIINWFEVKEDFCADMQKAYLKKLSALKSKYKNGESIEVYVQGQFDVFKSFFPKLNDQELILLAISGLPGEIQLSMNEYKDVSTSVFKSFCKTLDQVMKVKQAASEADN